MDERKQYARKVVINIIHFMARSGVGIKPSKEEIDLIPEDLYQEIISSLLAARAVRQARAIAAMSSAISPEEILEKIMKEACKDSEKD